MGEEHAVITANECAGAGESNRAIGLHLEKRLRLGICCDTPNRVPSGNASHNDVTFEGVRRCVPLAHSASPVALGERGPRG
jgi:hypothetical protein